MLHLVNPGYKKNTWNKLKQTVHFIMAKDWSTAVRIKTGRPFVPAPMPKGRSKPTNSWQRNPPISVFFHGAAEHKMGILPNGWFIMENPTKWMISGYLHFRTPPYDYVIMSLSSELAGLEFMHLEITSRMWQHDFLVSLRLCIGIFQLI